MMARRSKAADEFRLVGVSAEDSLFSSCLSGAGSRGKASSGAQLALLFFFVFSPDPKFF